MSAGRLDLTGAAAIERHQDATIRMVIPGVDWSAAVFTAQVRATLDAPGSPLIDLAIAAAGSQGISRTVTTLDGIPTTTVIIQISQATLDAVAPYPANGAEPNASTMLKWDLHVTPSGGARRRLLEGDIELRGGVYRND